MDLYEIRKEEAVNQIMRLRNKRIREEKAKNKHKTETPHYQESQIDYYISENRVRQSKRRGRK